MSIKYVKIEMEIDGLNIKDFKKLDCLKSWLHESTKFFITGSQADISSLTKAKKFGGNIEIKIVEINKKNMVDPERN